MNYSSYNNVIKFLLYPQLVFLLVDAFHRVNEKPHHRRQFRGRHPRDGSRQDEQGGPRRDRRHRPRTRTHGRSGRPSRTGRSQPLLHIRTSGRGANRERRGIRTFRPEHPQGGWGLFGHTRPVRFPQIVCQVQDAHREGSSAEDFRSLPGSVPRVHNRLIHQSN